VGHQLNPRSGRLLAAAEVVQRLRAEFAYVSADPEEGTRRALALADWIEARPEWIFMGKHAAWLERATRLRKLGPGEAVGITFGDDPSGPTLHALVLPDDLIKFGYASKEEETRLRPLVDRCARALDSEVVLF
jgi:hypothetical protein